MLTGQQIYMLKQAANADHLVVQIPPGRDAVSETVDEIWLKHRYLHHVYTNDERKQVHFKITDAGREALAAAIRAQE